jgi:hypothetical protein
MLGRIGALALLCALLAPPAITFFTLAPDKLLRPA